MLVPKSSWNSTALPASGGPASGAPASGVPASGVPASGVPASGAPASGVPASGVPASTDGGGEPAGYTTSPELSVASTVTPLSVTADAAGAYAWKSRTGLPVTASVVPASFVSIAFAL